MLEVVDVVVEVVEAGDVVEGAEVELEVVEAGEVEELDERESVR